MIEYEVIEHYDDGAAEPFGFAHLATQPSVGDIIMLHWLDGSEAYRVRVDRKSGTTLHVRSVS